MTPREYLDKLTDLLIESRKKEKRPFYICPNCRWPVQFFKQRDRVFWSCPNCLKEQDNK